MSHYRAPQTPGIDLCNDIFTPEEIYRLTLIASLTDPDANKILYWNDSTNSYDFLSVGSGLSITGGTLSAIAGTGDVIGPATNTNNYIPQWNGTNTKTLKNGLELSTTLSNTSTDIQLPSSKTVYDNLVEEKIRISNDGSLISLRDILAHIGSSFLEGLEITNNGNGTLNVASGNGYLKISNALDSNLTLVSIPASGVITPLDEKINTLYVDYNAGSPIVRIRETTTGYFDSNWDEIPFATVSRHGNKLYITSFVKAGTNAVYKNILATANLNQLRYLYGLNISESASMKIALTAGRLYLINEPRDVSAFDSNTGATFEYVYRNGTGGWTRIESTSIDPNHYDNGTGTLAVANTNKYINHFIYLVVDTPDKYHVVYGRDQYTSLSDAQSEGVPSTLPAELGLFSSSILIGRVITRQGYTVFQDIQSALTTRFTSSVPTSHPSLSGLSWTSSGHTGTATTLAAFDASGLPILLPQSTYAQLAGNISQSFSVSQLEIGNASDTTVTRLSAGQVAIEGKQVATTDNIVTFTNKRINPRVSSTTSSASLTPDIATADIFIFTAQAAGFTLNAPTNAVVGKTFEVILQTAAAKSITFNAIYKGGGVALPTTTVAGKIMTITCQYIDASNVIVHYSSTV